MWVSLRLWSLVVVTKGADYRLLIEWDAAAGGSDKPRPYKRSPLGFEQGDDLVVAVLPGEAQGRVAVLVHEIRVSSCSE